MSCICSAALARAPGEPGVLTAIGADSAPGARRGAGRLAAARSATAAIAAKRTMASVMVGVIEFFITRFLCHGLRSPAVLPSSGPVRPALTTLWTATACGLRLTDERSPAACALQCAALPEGQVSAPGPQVFAY